MIYFSCPKCSTRLSANPAYIGKAVLCGKCKAQVIVPKPPIAVRVDPVAASGRQPTLPGKVSQRHLVAAPPDATLPLPVQGNKRRLSWLSSKEKTAAGVLVIVLMLIVGSAVSLRSVLRDQESTPLAQEPASETHSFHEKFADGDLNVNVYVDSVAVHIAVLNGHPNKVVHWRVWEFGPITDEHGNNFFPHPLGPGSDGISYVAFSGSSSQFGIKGYPVVPPSMLRVDPGGKSTLALFYEGLPLTSKEASVVATTSDGRKILFHGQRNQ
jgi:hypothetical protein